MIVPNLDIGSPHGNPTIAGIGGANATNEIVFDDKIPGDEQEGQCVFSMEVSDMNLDTDPRALVMEQIKWLEPPNVGNVAAEEVKLEKVPTVKVVYSKMPDRWDAFGRKQLTLAFAGRDWKWYQDVEFFWHYEGTGCPSVEVTLPDGKKVKDPNWFFYWSQHDAVRAVVTKAMHNPVDDNQFFHAQANGRPSEWRISGRPPRTWIRIAPGDTNSLSGFLGICAHEGQHENDFWSVVWEGEQYNAQLDRDRDSLRDAWERVNGGMRVYLQPGRHSVFETDTFHCAWSDVNADRAAQRTVNNNLSIDNDDWSDLRVSANHVWVWEDDNPPNHTNRFECEPTRSGNHKHFFKD